MREALILLLVMGECAAAQERVVVRPGLLEERTEGGMRVWRTAGLTLAPLGAVEANAHRDPEKIENWAVRVPVEAREAKWAVALPMGVIGVLRSGAVLANPMSPVSYRGQGLWHLDAVRGLWQARGATRAWEELVGARREHSPLLGYALDGYPIYGPYGWDALRRVARMRSSYRLRAMRERRTWADGTVLAPGQEGPAVSATEPLGTYVEDYEYVDGAGELDVHNGRLAVTPDYPQGTYAYFLTMDEAGAPEYPYVVGPRFRGVVREERRALAAGEVELRFAVKNARGENVRQLELVHEKPMHLIVVSEDLGFFDHVHPEVDGRDEYVIRYRFPGGGKYRLYAGYTRPGGQGEVEVREQVVPGEPRATLAWKEDEGRVKELGALRVSLQVEGMPKVGGEVRLRFRIEEKATGAVVRDLTPWLGAWGHVVAIDETGGEFLHLHPVDPVVETPVSVERVAHTHVVLRGPSPAEMVAVAGFAKAGMYRVWMQFEWRGTLHTVPFAMRVGVGEVKKNLEVSSLPRVLVGATGYEPARLELNGASEVEFLRTDARGCGGEVVFPELGVKKTLPVGEVVRVRVPEGEWKFNCGMGMMRGAVVVRGAH